MDIFYHLSHFLEILTGIYFGGFALLGFMQEGAIQNIYSKISDQQEAAINAQILADDYYKLRVISPNENGSYNFLTNSFKWTVVKKIGQLTKFCIGFSDRQVSKIGPDAKSELILKKYFPSFFFTGCFCFVLILLSAFQTEKLGDAYCRDSINAFLLFYLFSTIIFNIWALFILPHKVNRIVYMNLIFKNVMIIIVLIALTIICSLHNPMPQFLNSLLNEDHKARLVLIVLIAIIFPLGYVLVKFVVVLTVWLIPIYFTNTFLDVFSKSKNDLETEIENLESSEGVVAPVVELSKNQKT